MKPQRRETRVKILPNGLAVVEGDHYASRRVEEHGCLNVDDGLINQVKQHIPVGGVVLDIGACLGDHAITYSRLVGPSGFVHAFEPNPIAFECLQYNLTENQNVTQHPIALSDKTTCGRVEIGVGFEHNLGASRFIEGNNGLITAQPLDSYLTLNRLDFIKIDAEGSEPKILRGAAKTIAKFRPVILIEVNAHQLRALGSSKEELLSILGNMGYNVAPVFSDYYAEEYDAICLPRGIDDRDLKGSPGTVGLPGVQTVKTAGMRFHVLGIPQIDTNKNFALCGFLNKIVNFCRMMKELGHTVFLYTGEHNTAPCDEAVCVITDDERKKWLGNTHYVFAGFGKDFAMWGETNKRMIVEIGKRKQPHDFICHVGGSTQHQVTQAHLDCLGVEFGVGYEGIIEKYVVFESQSWRQYCYGKYGLNDRFFDTTIHGYFDVAEFPMGDGKGDYLLYVGRLTPRKGMCIIEGIAKATKLKVKLIGLGNERPQNCEYIGPVSIEERAKLMGSACAVLIPTMYNEPFGSVVAEANLCGTPVITTDYGSFPELVQNGINGYRCNILRDFVKATNDVKTLNRDLIRTNAIAKFSLGVAKPQYQAYFERLSTLWEKGWYAK